MLDYRLLFSRYWRVKLETDWFFPFFGAPARGDPLEFRDETYPAKTRGMGLPYVENCIILTSTVFYNALVWRADGQTDGLRDGRAIAF